MRNTNIRRALHSPSGEYLILLLGALTCVLLAPRSVAGPLVIEQAARITSPDPSYTFGSPMAIGGNSIIIGALRFAPNPEFPGQNEVAAFLYERNASGTWILVRKLAEFRSNDPSTGGFNAGFDIAMNSLVAAVAVGEVLVFERTAAGWVRAPAAVEPLIHTDLEVHSGRILSGQLATSCYDAMLIEKRAGTWTAARDFLTTPPDPFFNCPSENDIDLASNRVIIGRPSNEEEPLPTQVHIWDRNSDGSWPVSPSAIVPVGPADGEFLTIEGDDAIVSSRSGVNGPFVLKRNGGWSVVGRLQRPDGAMTGPLLYLDLLNGFFVGATHADGIAIFQRNASGAFDYVAKAVVNDELVDNQVTLGLEISGRRLIASGVSPRGTIGVVYVFDLPADFSQPALIQDDFEDRNLAEWTSIPGSVASVLSNGLSLFYRQTSVEREAGATRTGVDMKNQSIEADVVIRSFAPGGERWAGLTVRQRDPGNYYYLTLRNTSVLSLRKLENGVISVLSSVTLPINLMTRHKLRLEAIGRRIRGYVDGQLRVEALDTTHKHGTAGIRMFKTAADYDNVVISPNPQTTLLSDDFEPFVHLEHEQWWFPRLGSWSEVVDGSIVFAQTSLNGGGRVTTNLDADDQAIQVRAKATQFATGGDPWFGVVARLQDDNNFYYLTVRRSNTVSLRRLQNGQITVLDSASLPVTAGTWYTLRLEAIGSSLRGYVNERPLVEAKDSTFAEGTYGLATSRATARFDNVRVTQP